MEYTYDYTDPILGNVDCSSKEVAIHEAEIFESTAWECEWEDGYERARVCIADFTPL